MTAPPTAKCRSCGAAIFWAASANGRPMPVDAEPSPRGNVQLFQRDGRVLAKVLGREAAESVRATAAALKTDPRLRLNHFVTCPGRDQHRSPR